MANISPSKNSLFDSARRSSSRYWASVSRWIGSATGMMQVNLNCSARKARIEEHLVPHFINTTPFAARDFWARRGASDAHTLQRSVRSEQRRLAQKEPPPAGLRRFSVLASLLLGHSPTAGDAPSSRLARTENRRNKRGRIYETGYLACALCLGTFAASHLNAENSAGNVETPKQWSFRNHVQPVLAKFGCSAGACHGAAAGQNGFKLSLRGYDDMGDWRALTRHALGRRIVPSDPSASLLVQKPTGVVPHKGGVKFSPESQEFR